MPCAGRFGRLQRGKGIGDISRLVAEHQQPPPVALAEKAFQRHGIGDLCETQNAALLGGLDDIGPHPLAVHPRHLGMTGQDRLQLAAPISTAFCTM